MTINGADLSNGHLTLYRGTAAELAAAAPLLRQGEPAVETDTLRVKIGTGTTAWAALPYQDQRGTGGAAATCGIATLVGGTVVVATTAVTADSLIFLTGNVEGAGTEGFQRVSARTPGTSFTILSSEATDVSQVAWHIIEPV